MRVTLFLSLCLLLTFNLLWLAACASNNGRVPPVAPTAAPASNTAATTGISTPNASGARIASGAAITDTKQMLDRISNEQHDTIMAADGSGELLIPSGALPAGTSASDIKMREIDPAQAQITMGGNPPLSVYKLEPDGLQFAKPVLLQLTRDASSSKNVSSLFTISGNQAAELSPVIAEFDAEHRQVTLMAPLTHFSTLVQAFNIKVEIPDELDEPVGKPFTVDAFVTTAESFRFLEMLVSDNVWTASAPVAPVEGVAGSRGQTTGILNQGNENFYGTFTCQASGNGIVSLGVTIEYKDTYDLGAPFGGLLNRRWYENFTVSTKINCKQMTPTPSPQPTGSQVRGAAPPAISIDLGAGPANPLGSTVLVAQGEQTEVRVDLKPNGNNANQFAFIQQGTCHQLGPAKYPLSNVVNGSSRTVIGTNIGSLLSGNLVVNVGPSVDQPNKSLACGAIPQGSVVTLGPGRDGDQSPAYAVLLAAGNQTQVTLNVGLTEDLAEQPAALYAGSCSNLGSSKYHLGNVKFGASRTTLNVPLTDLLNGGNVVAIAKSVAEPNDIVACGDLSQ